MLRFTSSRSFLRSKEISRLGPFIRTSKISKRRKDTQSIEAPHLVFKAPELTAVTLACQYFDDHYRKVFGQLCWPSIRLALLTQPKHCALINNFAPAEDTRAFLREKGSYSVREQIQPLMEAINLNSPTRSEDPTKTEEEQRPKKPTLEEIEDQKLLDIQQELTNSMSVEETKGRLIRPTDNILSGLNSAEALQDFIPSDSLKGMDGFVEEEDYFKSYQKEELSNSSIESTLKIRKKMDLNIKFPKNLDPFIFPRSVISRFPQPRKTLLGTYDYFCMDLASLLPVLALNMQPGDKVLDLCSGPGGKSLAMLQTLIPIELTCNDFSGSRLKRVMDMVDMYMKDVGNYKDQVTFKRSNAIELPYTEHSQFDKVLADVPCFTDRHVMNEPENNIFSSSRKKERIRMPELQESILVAAIKCARPGGSIVYSTCSLSPMQNDGVVFRALKNLWENTSFEFYVNDLSEAFAPFKSVMNLVNDDFGLKYGQLVLPNIVNNFGPMYISKITRIK